MLDLLHGNLLLALFGGGQVIEAVGIGTAIGKDAGHCRNGYEQGRNNESGLHVKFADGCDFRQQLLVLGLVDQIGKQHQQARHQGEHGQQA